MKELFTANCPYCNSEITGSWDWEKGDICVQGYCEKCKVYILEDEADWDKNA